MRMSDFVVRDAIVPDLAATNKEGVIREMVESLRDGRLLQAAASRRTSSRPSSSASCSARPASAAASPSRTPSTPASIAWSAPSPSRATGVAFDSLDGEPVHVFVLLISPQDRPGDHLRALENVSRSLRDDNFVAVAAPGHDAQRPIWGLLDDSRAP